MSDEPCPFHDLPSGTVVQIEFGDGRVPSPPDDPWRIDRATLSGNPSLAKHVARVTRD